MAPTLTLASPSEFTPLFTVYCLLLPLFLFPLFYATIAPPTSAASAKIPAIEDATRCRCRSSSK
jgi:hypothetical protein